MRKGFSEQRQHQTTIQNRSQTRNRHINFVAGLYNLAIFICFQPKEWELKTFVAMEMTIFDFVLCGT